MNSFIGEINSKSDILENTTISLESITTTEQFVTIKHENTTDAGMDSGTLHVLLGAIAFVFVTTFICIMLCTIYANRKKTAKDSTTTKVQAHRNNTDVQQ